VDELLAADRCEFKSIIKANRESTQNTAALGKLSCCANTSTANSGNLHRYVPKLTEQEKTLLKDNEGCFKCRHLFVPHCSKDCPNYFPDLAMYKTITAKDIDIAKHARKGKTVAAIAPTDNDSDTEPASNPVVVILRQNVNPVTYAV
jgi:hypothetical protein